MAAPHTNTTATKGRAVEPPSNAASGTATSEGIHEVIRVSTHTIDAATLARVAPDADAELVARLQRIRADLEREIPTCERRRRGLGVALSLAEYAVDFALLFATAPKEMKHERQFMQDAVAAWVMLSGEGSSAAIDSANGLGSLAAMTENLLNRWKPDFLEAARQKDVKRKILIVNIVVRTLWSLLPVPPSPVKAKPNDAVALANLIVEGLGGKRASTTPRSHKYELLASLLETAGVSSETDEEVNKPRGVERALNKHRASVRSRVAE